MTQPTRHELTLKKVLLHIDGMESAVVRYAHFTGSGGDPLPLRLYYPIHRRVPPPIVVIVGGYADPGYRKFLGCSFMDIEACITLAQLIAASGLAAVTYENREPATDLHALLAHLRSAGAELGVDGQRIGLWGMSGCGPLALAASGTTTCAVLSNAYTCDLDGTTHVADAARTFGFAVPECADVPRAPLFVIRSGRDEMPGLNAALGRLVARALTLNLDLTLVNHPDAPHAFELHHDSERTRQILRQALAFLQSRHLGTRA
jgi:dienelactone hydrolase